jgi:hypothetical protein
VRGFAVAILVGLVIALSACSPATTSPPSTEPSRATAPTTTESRPATTSSPSARTLVSGVALPPCTPGAPHAADTITFVASGHAWALSPSGDHLTCLFEVTDPGPFEWGPLGDRALLGGLEVKGVAGGPSRAASAQTSAAITWSRPTGKSIVYVPARNTTLAKVLVDGTSTQDVTPLPSSTYLSVTYHPSGEAFAFAVERGGGESIWTASNIGKSPKQLVFSDEGTTFGALGFDVDGKHLLYAAQHADDHPELHSIDVTDTKQAPVVWEGAVGWSVMDIQPGLVTGTVAWTTGTSCADRIAMARTSDGTVRALGGKATPTRAVGWVGPTRLLVATGGCGEPLELSVLNVSNGSVMPLVSGVSAAAVRTAVPTPAAPLPTSVEGSGFS